MSRLAAAMRCDVRLQRRNGFYWAVAFLLGAWAVVVTQLPAFAWAPWLPALVLGNLSMATFFFMAGLLLLEKNEGTLEALVVTPLTISDYLTSKVATLTALSVAENLFLVLITHGPRFSPLPMVSGIVLASAVYCLTGFISVARYDSINEFLFPSMLWVAVLSLPFLHYAGLWTSWLMYLHPLQAPLVLMKGAFFELRPREWAYGFLYSLLSIALLFGWSKRSFRRFVIAREGVR